MREGTLEYIIIGIIISVIVYIILRKVEVWISTLRNRRVNRARRTINTNPSSPVLPHTQNPPRPANATHNPNSPQTTNRPPQVRPRPSSPPALPQRVQSRYSSRESYPRCPICRSSNKPGREQKIFRDAANNRWRCIDGHVFNS